MALIVRRTPAKAYEGVMQTFLNLKEIIAEGLITFQSATAADQILRFHENLIVKRDYIVSAAEVRGIAAYARAQEDDINYDVVTEANAVLTALQLAIDFIEANFPATTFLSFNATTDRPQYLNIPAGQLNGYRALLEDVSDLIDTSEM